MPADPWADPETSLQTLLWVADGVQRDERGLLLPGNKLAGNPRRSGCRRGSVNNWDQWMCTIRSKRTDLCSTTCSASLHEDPRCRNEAVWAFNALMNRALGHSRRSNPPAFPNKSEFSFRGTMN